MGNACQLLPIMLNRKTDRKEIHLLLPQNQNTMWIIVYINVCFNYLSYESNNTSNVNVILCIDDLF